MTTETADPTTTLPCPTEGCEGKMELQQSKNPLTYRCAHCKKWVVEEGEK
jgi:hypothetical protein